MKKRHDFSFGRYFHPEKSPMGMGTPEKSSKGSPKPVRSTLVYNSYGNVDQNGRRVPARKYMIGYRPER